MYQGNSNPEVDQALNELDSEIAEAAADFAKVLELDPSDPLANSSRQFALSKLQNNK